MSDGKFIYGGWWQVIDGPKKAIVKMEQPQFVAALKRALVEKDGDVDEAMAALLREMVRRLRQAV